MKGKGITGISSDALGVLLEYHYPGNVRELRNIIEYAFAMCPGSIIKQRHLPRMFQRSVNSFPYDMQGRMAHFESQLIYSVGIELIFTFPFSYPRRRNANFSLYSMSSYFAVSF